MAKQISTEISTQVLHYKPGGAPARFELTVNNDSDRFAAFQVELSAAGSDPKLGSSWYRLVPAISSKIPSGDYTRFQVEILAVPPVPGGFTGTMNLTVRVFSLELNDEDRQILRLVVEGTGVLPPTLELSERKFQGYPGDAIDVSVAVSNSNRQAVDVTLRLSGIDLNWFPNGSEKQLHIPARGQVEAVFVCQLPDAAQAPSGVYTLSVEATQLRAVPVQAKATLTVLPAGFVEFRCTPTRQQLPMKPRRWLNPAVDTATFALELENQSNLAQEASVDVRYQDESSEKPRRWFPWFGGKAKSSVKPPDLSAKVATNTLEVKPGLVNLGVGETAQFELIVRRKLPWIGWSRRRFLQAKAIVSDPRLDLRNDTQTLELRVSPQIPLWLQLAGILFVFLLGWMILGRQRGHTGPVTAVQFSGQADEVVSVSTDGTVRRWQVNGTQLKSRGILEQGDKAVRVVRYRPVNNDQVAAGFENGQIQIWNLLFGERQSSFSYRNDDRVFDLAFPQDSRSLFSGHGSGLILQWGIEPGRRALTQVKPLRGFKVDYAVQSLALVGATESHLAIAGRYNRLTLLNLATETNREMPYRTGGFNDYIMSLATASQQPDLLATADNRGTITLWNLRRCLADSKTPCEQVDDWSTGHGGAAIRSVAFSADGCNLVSAGDDGRVVLWSLTSDGTRSPALIEGKTLYRSSVPLNAVDLIRTKDRVLVASGSQDHQVRLHSIDDATALAGGTCRSFAQ
ncbi:MAG: WD40 repeat domain-containing protein [Microcoleus sp. SIO2G3]|nr:WD40 repeat domain-containing protein [Microcoleus sp. SIO2G3]